MESGPQHSRLLQTAHRHRFDVLLGTLLLLMFASPALYEFGPRLRPGLIAATVTAIFVLLLLSAVLAVSETRRTVHVAAALVVPAIFFQVANLVIASKLLFVAAHLLDMLFLVFTAILILRFIFAHGRVTLNRIWAALCVYLLMGVFWAQLYSLIAALDPEAFAFAFIDDRQAMQFGARQTVYTLYYSLVTITTLGYGDIIPVSATARMAAGIEALFGQLYLAVLIARLVGLHIAQSTAE